MRQPLAPGGSAREQINRRVLAGLMVVLGVVGLGWGAGHWLRSRPSLEEAIELADAGRLDASEAKLRARLAANPDDGAAALLLAQAALKRLDAPATLAGRPPEEWAQRALDHLRRVRPSNPRMAATLEVCRGRALHRLLRFVEAEAAWLEALEVDPIAPEAGWHLLNLYYVQERQEEARRLALRLHEVEPDPQDRVRLLVELLRLDARPPDPGSIAILLEPVVRQDPDDLHSSLALGLARTRASQVEAGIDQLHHVVHVHPDRVEAWDSLLTALDESGHVDPLVDELGRLPAAFAESPRMWKHRARVAQVRNRWKEAVDLYRRAHAAEPSNRPVEYRLSQALRHVGEIAEAERIERRARLRDDAIREVRSLFEQANTTPDLGRRPHPELYQRIAEARERMQLLDEARAWHRLVLRDDPEETVSRAALKRLGAASDPR
jgi:tetratricopeptide (TPR) repeat protein